MPISGETNCSASMRPGLLCPGKRAGRVAHAYRHVASMRPGLLCPGKQPLVGAGVVVLTRFNEAGAVMPRKGGWQRRD